MILVQGIYCTGSKRLTGEDDHADASWFYPNGIYSRTRAYFLLHLENPYTEAKSIYIILDEYTLAVRKFYREWGVEPKNLNHDPDDHIGLEMEFMGLLTEKSLDALDLGDMKQAKRVNSKC